MSDQRFERQGYLWLICQEGGFAEDAFGITEEVGAPSGNVAAYGDVDMDSLAYEVANFFGAVRQLPSGYTYIGRVRITIERLEDPA